MYIFIFCIYGHVILLSMHAFNNFEFDSFVMSAGASARRRRSPGAQNIGAFSNTNSPPKHMQQIFKTLQKARESAVILVEDLPSHVDDATEFWGHDEQGMFLNSTVLRWAEAPALIIRRPKDRLPAQI